MHSKFHPIERLLGDFVVFLLIDIAYMELLMFINVHAGIMSTPGMSFQYKNQKNWGKHHIIQPGFLDPGLTLNVDFGVNVAISTMKKHVQNVLYINPSCDK